MDATSNHSGVWVDEKRAGGIGWARKQGPNLRVGADVGSDVLHVEDGLGGRRREGQQCEMTACDEGGPPEHKGSVASRRGPSRAARARGAWGRLEEPEQSISTPC